MVGRLWQLCAGRGCPSALSEAYRRLWDGRRQSHRRLCMFLGPDTGRRETCGSCRGRVQLKVYRCGHAAHAARPETTLPACEQCPDFTAQPPRETVS
ncbi:hypothetical protein AYO44_10495 [Planctomycetaceae bacterium SCGC AG-212-F19]|nr:hypothetical protein AYO44_10495 [Planctomycetaceae bacterium SCGC AG-212-F19]